MSQPAARPSGFSTIPPEIRCQIWKWAIPRRIVKVTFDYEIPDRWARYSGFSITTSEYPTVLGICQESRYETLRSYTYWHAKTAGYYFPSPTILIGIFDVLYLAMPPVGYGLFALRYPAARTAKSIAIDIPYWSYALEQLFLYPHIRFENPVDLYLVLLLSGQSQGAGPAADGISGEEFGIREQVYEKMRLLRAPRHVPNIYFIRHQPPLACVGGRTRRG
ncbi:hypothetical protein F4821DRAFT_277030 [Hypoxylon rubiginosum]|uniref:Uncharacterized protein n=1 Tax=Hypoxylon rubiginosum TaxID=110542 RepID=A0ACC0CI90_9PEZI|nr:hypothetical protein F4821DRAFT_277030 [Hypoxylon rubiginosum]